MSEAKAANLDILPRYMKSELAVLSTRRFLRRTWAFQLTVFIGGGRVETKGKAYKTPEEAMAAGGKLRDALVDKLRED
jgi:hypothetical protein